ncbi:MAG: NADH-quinone oxidoreductase subunit J [Dehalococcoidia bacterium]|jgi:NADH-quinone oxidoreductase subunit J|nr:NADH-quinone oxidoreductase subunit J [Dehalococcoidia bacterium]|tara:strand:- start:1716 stop:2204 length:489 start_codon:yes stop_codon:yes gene_type:complete
MAWIVFISLAVLTIGGALGVVVTRNVVHAALALLVSLIAVAGIYLVLFAEFLALVQVLIYGGAIIIVLMFAIMLTRNADYPRVTDNKQWPLAALAALAFLGVLAPSFIINRVEDTQSQNSSLEGIGESLFTTWAVPFEIASLVLLVALIGAIIIARSDEEKG